MYSVVLSGPAALSVYKALRQQWDTISPVKFTKKVRVPTDEEIDMLRKQDDVDFRDLEILLSDKKQRRSHCKISQKYFTGNSNGIVSRINTNNPFFLPEYFLVVSPAFLTAQLANRLSFVESFFVALWLGGTFTINTATGDLLSDREPMLTSRQLAYMEKKLTNYR